MTIISVSLNDKILRELDTVEEQMGYSGRSEMIRSAIRLLVADSKEQTKLSGHVHAVLVVVHDEKQTEHFSAIRHRHEKIIRTQIHTDLEKHKCMQVVILDGESDIVKKLVRELKTSKRFDLVKLILSS